PMPIDLQADALYFQALENGVDFGTFEERVVSPNFKSHFGARAKIGVILPHDCWEVAVQFLHYHARTRTEGDLWRLHMGLGDLLLARSWPVSCSLCLTPFWGLRYGEIRHKLKQDPAISMKNKFWGVGPEVGLEGIWSFCSWLGIYTRAAFSLLFGEFYIHQDIPPLKFFDEYRQTRNVLEMALGMRFGGSCFYGQVAFELYLFPGQNQLVRFVDDAMPGKYVANQGDLSLHGLSFGLGVYF
nr:hypothetical protein [Chlamydiota bacterium]